MLNQTPTDIDKLYKNVFCPGGLSLGNKIWLLDNDEGCAFAKFIIPLLWLS